MGRREKVFICISIVLVFLVISFFAVYRIFNNSKKSWTVITVINADNSGEHAALDVLQELEAGYDESAGINVLVMVDRSKGYDSSNGDWTGCRYYKVESDKDTRIISSLEMKDLGEIDMGNPRNISDFIDWSRKNYPAKHYLVTFLAHGMGIYGMSWDEDNKGSFLSIKELKEAFSGKNIDILAIDGCAMGMTEVVYELKTAADYIIVSEEVAVKEGYDYSYILRQMGKGDTNSETVAGICARSIFQNNIQYQLPFSRTIVDTGKTGKFIEDFNQFIMLLKAGIADKNLYSMILKARNDSFLNVEQTVDLGNFTDELFVLLNNTQDSSKYAQLKQAMGNIKKSYAEFIMGMEKGVFSEELTGLSLYFPLKANDPPFYWSVFIKQGNLSFLSDTQWKQFVLDFIGNYTPEYREANDIPELYPGSKVQIQLADKKDFREYIFTVAETGIYDCSLKVISGDPGLYLENADHSFLFPFGSLHSQALNPDQSDREVIRTIFFPGTYKIRIESLSQKTDCILELVKTAPQKIDVNKKISGNFPPKRGGTGAPSMSEFYYYSVSLKKGNHRIKLDISNHVLVSVRIFDAHLENVLMQINTNEGEDVNREFFLEKGTDIVIEIIAVEWSGTFNLQIE